MIGRLKGIIVEKQPPHLIIDVHGVGYEVQASMNTFYRLPDLNQETILFTHLVVREDVQALYGFYDLHERSLFRSLIKVNGVGPKVALAILSNIDPNGFVRCVYDHDISGLVHIPGIGKKTAERLIVEMRDRLADWHTESSDNLPEQSGVTVSSMNDVAKDAISALIALGYKPQEASKAISKISQKGLNSEELIRLALKNMTK